MFENNENTNLNESANELDYHITFEIYGMSVQPVCI